MDKIHKFGEDEEEEEEAEEAGKKSFQVNLRPYPIPSSTWLYQFIILVHLLFNLHNSSCPSLTFSLTEQDSEFDDEDMGGDYDGEQYFDNGEEDGDDGDGGGGGEEY